MLWHREGPGPCGAWDPGPAHLCYLETGTQSPAALSGCSSHEGNADFNKGPFLASQPLSILSEGFIWKPRLRLSGKRISVVQIFVHGALFPNKTEPDATSSVEARPWHQAAGRGWEATRQRQDRWSRPEIAASVLGLWLLVR